MTNAEFNQKIFELLSRVEYLTGKQLDDAFKKIELLIKFNFKENNSKDVWYNNETLKKQIEKELQQATGRIVKITEDGISGIWELANKRSDDIVFQKLMKVTGLSVVAEKIYNFFNRIIPKNVKPLEKIKITETTIKQIMTNPRRDDALQAFLKRKVEGLNLSARVWKLSDEQILPLIESKLAEGISMGMSADELSRGLRPYLENPDALFRRVRDVKSGKLKLSVAAQKYEPGTGVYRSAYKNAKRLAASEVNFAYRTADHDRWAKLDFILGINVKRSNSKRGNCDVCDSLVGQYPKNYHFTGFHPWCICFATPILMDEDAFINQLTGMPVAVPEMPVPDNFITWVKEHKDYLKTTNSPPYFVKYNQKIVDDILSKPDFIF